MNPLIRPALMISGMLLLPVVALEESTPFSEFEDGVQRYLAIHRTVELEAGRPSPTKSVATMESRRKALAEGIRVRRPDAGPGDLFTERVANEFRRVIRLNLKHHPRRISTSIRGGELVQTRMVVNGEYPSNLPLETMPATLLMAFPQLPGQLEYRMVGRTLILRDVTANLVVDFIPDAMASPSGPAESHGN